MTELEEMIEKMRDSFAECLVTVDAFDRRITKIEEKLRTLDSEVDQIRARKKKNKERAEKRWKDLNILDIEIRDAIEQKAHPAFEADLLYSDQIMLIMSLLKPDNPYYETPKYMFRPGEQFTPTTTRTRSIGQRMSRLGFTSLRTRKYHQAIKEDGLAGSTRTRTVWVLRNLEKYQDHDQVTLAAIADKQWNSVLQYIDAAIINSESPSFM